VLGLGIAQAPGTMRHWTTPTSLAVVVLSAVTFGCGASNGNPGTEPDAGNDASPPLNPDAGAAGDSTPEDPEGGDAAGGSTPPNQDGSTPVTDGGATVDSGHAAPPIAVSGNIIVEGSAASPVPIAARKVTIVDANGTRTDVTSDPSGAFTVSGVVPPYDAVVAAGPLARANPIAFLGVSAPHPRLLGWPDSLPAPSTNSATINVVVKEPPCGSSACNIDFSPYDCSFSGTKVGGGETTSYLIATTQTFSPIPINWSGSASAACVGFNVLVSDNTYTHFWYTQVGVSNVANGTTVTTAAVTPVSIPSLGTITLSATESPLMPAAWGEPELLVLFNYPSANGNGFAYLTRVNSGTSIVSGVPNIVGATLSANAGIGSDFNAPMPDPNLTQRVFAAANKVPLSTSTVSLTLGPPLSLSAPTENGNLSASTGSVAWTWGSSGEVMDASLVAIGDASASVEVEVYTAGTRIDLARLAKAGVTLTPSLHRGRFAGLGKLASLDAMLDENTLAQPDGSASVDTSITFTLTP
jgi:hypothetical protein